MVGDGVGDVEIIGDLLVTTLDGENVEEAAEGASNPKCKHRTKVEMAAWHIAQRVRGAADCSEEIETTCIGIPPELPHSRGEPIGE